MTEEQSEYAMRRRSAIAKQQRIISLLIGVATLGFALVILLIYR